MRRLLLVAACAAACSSFVGSSLPVTPPLDATVDTPPDATPPRDVASLDVAPFDVPPLDAPTPTSCFWDPGWGCAPYGASSCATDSTCAIADLSELIPRGACVTAGAHPLGDRCADGAPSTRCARGLVCLLGRCAVACCGATDSARCAAADPRSACATPTQSFRVWACTLPGACDYLDDDCPDGQRCAPTSRFGDATCVEAGVGADGAPCSSPLACERGLTCTLPFGASIGRCRRVCNPRDTRRSPCPGACSTFGDRPADFGVCP